MRRIASLVIGFVVATVVAAAPAGKSVTLEQLKVRAAVDAATPEGQTYLKQFFTNQWMVAMDSADGPCRAYMLVSRLHEKIVIGLVIGIDGYPVTALVSPDDEGTRCIAERLKRTRLGPPPHDDFAVYMPYEFMEPAAGPGSIMPAGQARRSEP